MTHEQWIASRLAMMEAQPVLMADDPDKAFKDEYRDAPAYLRRTLSEEEYVASRRTTEFNEGRLPPRPRYSPKPKQTAAT